MKVLTSAVVAIVLTSAPGLRAQRIETMLPVPPLPTIGLPLPHIGLPPAELNKTSTTAVTGAPRTDIPITVGGVGYLPPYFYLAPWYFTPPAAAVTRTDAPAGRSATRTEPETLPPTGTLMLDVQPVAAMQVIVDGYYIGSTDLTGTGIELEAGPHRIELKASGYEPIGFDVRIVRQQSITYRDTLKPSSGGAAPKAVVAPPRAKMYVIPGCYAGNLPPDEISLPEGCDASKATTLER